MKMDKDIKTEVKITWDCFSTKTGKVDMAEMVKRGEDVLPIEAAFLIYRISTWLSPRFAAMDGY